MKAEDFKLRIIEERELLRKALSNEQAATQKVYTARESLKRIEDVIIQEIQDNPKNKNEKDRTAAKRMARINDDRYIAGLKAITDAEVERINFQASVIDHQTRIQVFTTDYEFALLGRRDSQFQFAILLAKVLQADTTTETQMDGLTMFRKYGATNSEQHREADAADRQQFQETKRMSINDALKEIDATRGPSKEVIQVKEVNADLIHAFLDTSEGRAVIGDWLREHGRPVMADVLEKTPSDIMRRAAAMEGQAPQALSEETKKEIAVALHSDNDPVLNLGKPEQPEGVTMKAGLPICSTCGMQLQPKIAGCAGNYPNSVDPLYVHPNNPSCAAINSAYPEAKLRKSEGPKGSQVGGVDV
jgi:hypothetical protein